MQLDPAVKQRIAETIENNRVVLFMKGTRSFPQCGFSATVVGILEGLIPGGYETVNVLQDPSIREGIKVFSNWPTIPQLYIGGEFVGGCDIVREMSENGELHQALGLDFQEPTPPTITLTDAAAKALKEAAGDVAAGEGIRVSVHPNWAHALDITPKAPGDFELQANGHTLFVQKAMAPKLDGLTIDFQDGPGGTGFKMDNPNAPAQAKQMSVEDLKAALDADEEIHLFDVRTPQEIAIATIDGGRVLDQQALADIEDLPKDSKLVFFCHKGQRSMAAAQRILALGFTNVHNLAGGIDAWSQRIDPNVKRY